MAAERPADAPPAADPTGVLGAAPELASDQWLAAAVARYEGPLTMYAARIVGDAERAADVVQDVFLRLCRQDRSAIEGRLAQWLYRVCRNCALDARRKSARALQLEDDQQMRLSPEPGPAEVIESQQMALEALRLLRTLTDNQQEVLRLKFQHGLSYKEIAEVTGLSVSNVGFLMHTGLKLLRQRLMEPDAAEGTSHGEQP